MTSVRSSRRRVLLTGGAGFIGSHLAQQLIKNNDAVTIVDNLNDFYSPSWKRANLDDCRRIGTFDFVQADICDFPTLRDTFSSTNPDVVIHLAAYAGVRPSIDRPRLYDAVNIAGTTNVLELCREFSVGKFIFGSSSSVYGASSRAPFVEEQVGIRPISPYAATKMAGELMAFTYAHLFRIPTVCLRFFTVFGPRQRPDLAIHRFVARIEAGLPIPIYGDGRSGRDYTYVDDIVAGVLAAIDYTPEDFTGAPYEVFNIGNSSPVTLNELIDSLEAIMGRIVVRDYQPAQAGDVPLTWADVTKARNKLGYIPRTSLKEGLTNFVQWYRTTSPEVRLEVKRLATHA